MEVVGPPLCFGDRPCPGLVSLKLPSPCRFSRGITAAGTGVSGSLRPCQLCCGSWWPWGREGCDKTSVKWQLLGSLILLSSSGGTGDWTNRLGDKGFLEELWVGAGPEQAGPLELGCGPWGWGQAGGQVGSVMIVHWLGEGDRDAAGTQAGRPRLRCAPPPRQRLGKGRGCAESWPAAGLTDSLSAPLLQTQIQRPRRPRHSK